MKIPLLNEIQPFDNSVNLYSSISGHTFENMSSEKPVPESGSQKSRCIKTRLNLGSGTWDPISVPKFDKSF